MILKKLEIQGFKSFAKKTVIEFSDDVTGIIGPNGSGKSNIVDAMRWVMGEQRIKPLRAGKMEDMIFSGTTEKKPLGYAQVSMTLDNSSGIFQSEYDEICVTRRLFRQGQSEYYINKTACRLKDVQELFMDTGLGREGYSVIGQGQIESIVNNSPYERKLLIEEAAGIVKYKLRKSDAEKNLEKAQSNLYRLNDILSEISSRLPGVKKQADKAEKYVALRNELKTLEIGVFVHRMDLLKKRLNDNCTAKSAIEESIAQIDADLALLDEKYRLLKSNAAEYDNELSEINKTLHGLISSYENAKSDLNLSKLQRDNYLNLIKSNQEEISRIDDSINTVIDQKNEVLKDISCYKSRLDELAPLYEEKKSNVFELKQKYMGSDDYIANLNGEIAVLDGILVKHQESLVALKSEIASKSYIKSSLDEKISESQKSLDSLNIELNDHLPLDVAQIKHSCEEASFQKINLEDQISKLNEKISGIFTDIQTFKAKLDLLEGYESAHQGYNYAVRKLLDMDHGLNGILGTVGSIVTTEDKYTEAVSKALGSAIESIITDDESTASLCINILKQNRWGRATFLPVNTVSGNMLSDKNKYASCAGYIATADELVKYDVKFVGIIKSLLARVVVADTLDNANKMAAATRYKTKIVTLEGEVLLPGGAITGGKYKNSDQGALKRKNEIKKIQSEIIKLKSEYERLIQKKTATADQYKMKCSELDRLRTEYEKIDQKNHALVQKNELLEAEKNKIAALINDYAAQVEKINIDMAFAETKSCNIEKDIVLTKDKIEKIKIELTKASAGGYKDDYLKALTSLNEAEKDFILAREKTQHAQAILDNVNAQFEELISSKTKCENTLKETACSLKSIEEKIEKLCNEDTGYADQKSELENRFAYLSQKKDSSSEDLYKINDEIILLNKQRAEASQRLGKVDVQIGKTDVEISHLQNDMMEDYSLTYAQASQVRQDENIDFDSTLIRINEIKDRIKRLGNINVDALEEYKQLKKRFDEMSAQRDDLIKSKEELVKIIEDIVKSMSELFNKQFGVIQKEFDRVFKILFNGGEARLILTQPDDLNESGVDIIARPPKTKLKNISALSGGEKSLAACALIFAILKIKPAPFCVMDEIDAALDDANVGRFCEYLKSISNDNQIILVTHKKRTMQAASSLYGVSVAADGITNVFSVKLSQINERGHVYEQQA